MSADSLENEPNKASGIFGIAIVFGVIGALAVSAGWFLVGMDITGTGIGSGTGEAADKRTTEVNETAAQPAARFSSLVKLEPIIVNLKKPEGAFIRIEIAVAIVPEVEKRGKLQAEELADFAVRYLKTVDYTNYTGPSGFLLFRRDLLTRLQIASEYRVANLFISTLVVE